jgi:hypothetical protein
MQNNELMNEELTLGIVIANEAKQSHLKSMGSLRPETAPQ